MSKGPLEGLKVLDLTEGVAGPYCTKLLADFGAEVIKVERPRLGDWARHRGPFFRDQPDPEHSLLFAYLNTNKRSVTLNLDSDVGQQAVRALSQSADILVEGCPPDYLPERDLNPGQLRTSNRRLVVTSIPLFARRGPYGHYRATELNLYAMSGLMSIVGGVGQPPLKAGGYQAQYMAGLQACVFTLFGAYQARTTGEGSWIDTSVLETSAKILEHTGEYTVAGSVAKSPEERRARGNYVHACREGYVTVTLYYFQMQTLANLLGNPSIAHDPRFASEGALRENEEIVRAELETWLQHKTADEAQTEGQNHHLLFTKVNNARDIIEHPHFRARKFFVEVDSPTMGRAEYPGPPFRLTGSPAVSPKAAPALGEANEMVLCDRLGYTRADLAELRATGII
jgi:CoA:oxalate CoA-transferase